MLNNDAVPRAPCAVSDLRQLENVVRTGDVVFIRIARTPFRQIAAVTRIWTNHVGIVTGFDDRGALIAESRIPFSCHTPFARFVQRSEHGRVAVLRLPRALTAEECVTLQAAARSRLGRLYDTGFNLESRRQFCSRFVREVLAESTGVVLGKVMTFRELLARSPGADLRLWKLWYFGRIPWERRTVTPASLYHDSALQVLFDGAVVPRLQRSNCLKPL